MTTTRTTQVHRDGELLSEEVEDIGPVDANSAAITYRLRRALAINSEFLAIDKHNVDQISAHVVSLTQQVNALIRARIGAFEDSDDTRSTLVAQQDRG